MLESVPLGGTLAQLNWLHLSDLHLGIRSARLLRPEYREALELDLRRQHERSGPWDLVIISGDLTSRGTEREFGVVTSTLDSLWNYFRSLGSEPCLLTVPGDMDFQWSLFPQLPALTAPAVWKRSTGPLEDLSRGLNSFSQWFASWRSTHPSPAVFKEGLLPGDFAATVLKEGSMIGVLGLNSMLRSAPGIRELRVEQLSAAIGKDLRQWAQQHELLLLVTHIAPVWLNSAVLDQLLTELVPPDRPFLHLCGGRHSNLGFRDPTTSDSIQPSRRFYIQPPSLFSEIRGPKAWGYFAGQFSLSGPRAGLRMFPRIASLDDGAITLASGTRPSADEAYDFSIESLRWKPPSKNTEESGERPLQVLSSQRTRHTPRLRVLTETSSSASPTAGMSLQATLDTDERKVSGLAWSPSGDALGIGLSDGQLILWHPDEQSPRWVVQAHFPGLEELCFSPDAQMLATGSDSALRLWSRSGSELKPAPLLSGGGSAMAWSSSNLLATYAEEGALLLWDMQLGARVSTLQSPQEPTRVHCLAWSPDGQTLACGCEGEVRLFLWKREVRAFAAPIPVSMSAGGFPGATLALAWMPGGSFLALGDRDGTILIWDAQKAEPVTKLEGHTSAVTSVSFSFDGRLLASMCRSGSIRLWRTDTWEEVARIEVPVTSGPVSGLRFSPTKHVLAALGRGSSRVQLWELDIDALLQAQAPSTTVHELIAKVVLVGEGRAGKSCLAQRLTQNRYEELESTHGMRFWSLSVGSQGAAGTSEKVRSEIILWDMGGQSEYQLVHQLFLRDSTLALMVMEPARGESALSVIEGWNQRLMAQAGARHIRKLLVGSKVDSENSPVDLSSIESLVKRCQFTAYVSTSAKTGLGIPELKAALEQAVDWGSIEKVSRPKLFQRLRRHIQRLRESKRVVLTFSELESELRQEMGRDFDPEALRAVVGQLSRQGLVADTRMGDGTRVLVLEIEQVERYAGSLILAARDNPHGVPALDVAKALSPSMQFPRIRPEERLRRDQELAVLDCVIELLLEHGLCLRHEGLLIFPSLFQPTHTEPGSDFSHSVSLHYDFSGPIDNIYASLITSLAISHRFGSMRLWEDRAEFGRAGVEASGVRRVQREGQGARGFARLDVYFELGTPEATRELFVSFVEQHLREHGVQLIEQLIITCACGNVFAEKIIRNRLAAGHPDIGCPECDRRTPLTLGAQQARERNPELLKQLQALRTNILKERLNNVIESKLDMEAASKVRLSQDMPLRILHLSDLHVGAGADPLSLLQPLEADLKDRYEGLGVERLDYLVISGDITNRAAPEEFEKAREFVSELIARFGLTSERCILVPGNHDLDWDTEVYVRRRKRQVDIRTLASGTYKEDGDGYYVRDDEKYPERFKNFSRHFYHPLTQKEYPLAPSEQCLSFFGESRLQFLAMNSAWEIDEYFTERSSICEQALSRGLDAANRELAAAHARGDLQKGDQILRLAVWHHPITGNEKIQADAFLGRLLQANVRVCLHGHVHEDRADLISPLHPERKIHVVGTGSFGAPTHHRPESVPRLFNLLEIQRDLRSMRVHTRCLRRQGGSWEGWAVWSGVKPGEKRTYYDVALSGLASLP
jgi:small GTP-binding protein